MPSTFFSLWEQGYCTVRKVRISFGEPSLGAVPAWKLLSDVKKSHWQREHLVHDSVTLNCSPVVVFYSSRLTSVTVWLLMWRLQQQLVRTQRLQKNTESGAVSNKKKCQDEQLNADFIATAWGFKQRFISSLLPLISLKFLRLMVLCFITHNREERAPLVSDFFSSALDISGRRKRKFPEEIEAVVGCF